MQRLSMVVQTDGSLSLEENLRNSLLACFSEFAEILKQMAVTHVSAGGHISSGGPATNLTPSTPTSDFSPRNNRYWWMKQW